MATRKGTTILTNSDVEYSDKDSFHVLPQPKIKRTKLVDIANLAAGPEDFIAALTVAGFHPRADNLSNVLSK